MCTIECNDVISLYPYYLRRTAKVMLSSLLVCLLVSLFVRVSVDNIAEIRVNGFSWNCPDRSGMIQGTIWKIWGASTFNPLGLVSFTKLGAAEVCALGVIIVQNVIFATFYIPSLLEKTFVWNHWNHIQSHQITDDWSSHNFCSPVRWCYS